MKHGAMGKSIKLLAVMLASFAVTVFLFRHQNSDLSSWAGVLFIMLLFSTPFAFPAVGTFIHNRPRTIFWTGVMMIAGGFAAMLGVFALSATYKFPPGITGTDPISVSMMWIVMSGIACIVLPRSMTAWKRTEQAMAPVKPAPVNTNKFDGLGEARRAVLTVTSNLAAFGRLFGPWIILLWAVPFIGLHIAAFHNGIAPSLFSAPNSKVDAVTDLLGERLPYVLASAFAFPIALVSWHRYILLGGARVFGFGVPAGVLLRYVWRLWAVTVFFSVLLKLVAGNAADVARLLGTTDKLEVAKVMFWCVLCFAIYLGSSFTLVFPAVAIGNRNFVGTDAARVTKPLGNPFRFGFVLSLLPFGVLWWGSESILERIGLTGPRLSLISYSLWLVPMTLMFLMLACCAVYVSRVYAAQSTSEEAMRLNSHAASPELSVAGSKQ